MATMTDGTSITVGDCLQAAFQALLRGDVVERDILCAMAERAFKNGEQMIHIDTPIPLGPKGTN